MNKTGGAGLFVLAGLALVIVGAIILTPLFKALLAIFAWGLIIIGAVVGIIGLVRLFSSGRD